MKASVGDRIIVTSSQVGHRPRTGRIVELRHADGTPPYLVHWDDTGQDALYFPGSDGLLQHLDRADQEAESPAVDTRRMKRWRIEVLVVEDGAETTARAVLHDEIDTTMEGRHGRAMRAPTDPDVPKIGDEVAVARALRNLAESLLNAAASTISTIEQDDVVLTK